MAKLGAMRGEIAKSCLDVIARSASDEAIHSFSARRDGLLACVAYIRSDSRCAQHLPTAIAGGSGAIAVHCLREGGRRFESSLRLLAQLRVRAAEVGRGGILADLDDAAADRAGAGKMLEQRLAVAAADRAGQF